MNGDCMDGAGVVWLAVLGYILFDVIVYAVTLSRSKKGLMITFRGWADLWVSSAWLLFLPLGIFFFGCDLCDQGSAVSLWRILGGMFLSGGLVSVLWLIFFVVKNNWFHPWNIFLALNTRMMAAFLVFLAVSKVWALVNPPKRDGRATMRGTFRSVVVTSAVFIWLVRPLVSVGSTECAE